MKYLRISEKRCDFAAELNVNTIKYSVKWFLKENGEVVDFGEALARFSQ